MTAVQDGLRDERIACLRREGIAARNALGAEERARRSAAAAELIASSDEFAGAGTVMIYDAVRGELSLAPLLEHPAAAGKRFVYPLCVSRAEMKAYVPGAWKRGAFGIREPDPEQSEEIDPSGIDLVICPCTVFDEAGNRIGMGAGYYDRFLPQCSRAAVMAAAFEAQKAPAIPAQPWDRPVGAVVTESRIYRTGRSAYSPSSLTKA